MSSDNITSILCQKLNFKPTQIKAVISMTDDGATVPFMARYRKEKTGGLDEVELRKTVEAIEGYRDLLKRRESMFKSLQERDLLTPQLKNELMGTTEIKDLEDLYAPHRPKRKTRASAAKELGLEPLAKEVYRQNKRTLNPNDFMVEGLPDIDAVWSGVRDIIAEWIADIIPLRRRLRELTERRGQLISKVVKKKEAEAEKFKDYFDHHDLFPRVPAHRLHAILRGKNEGFLRVQLKPDPQEAIQVITRMVIKGHSSDKHQLELAIQDAWERLMHPSLENEIIAEGKQKADTEAIEVFAQNLTTLLMEAPLGAKKTMAIDPGFRTGCKAVCLDENGKFLIYQTLFPFASTEKVTEAKDWVTKKVNDLNIEVIAIGNGTAGRETEDFIKGLNLNIPVVQVSESGASIYSASEEARREFPDLDLTVRGSISIGRRLQDPLAELVKLDPKSIGVGQYQHDVDQKALNQRLAHEVESCVNGVGVELNTASSKLLSHISGLGPKLAEGIIQYREENGAFKTRKELLKVPRLGAKAFEQSAGFIRIRSAVNPLDRSAVHPESYSLVEKMAKDQNSTVTGLIEDHTMRSNIKLESYVSDNLGMPTLTDILEELAKPGRDPRPGFELFQFDEAVKKPEDLREGMELPGIVTNVTKFGAFVDIGVHQDGLVHISQLADRFVDDPNKIVKVQQKVKVWVLEIDLKRKRIGLSMKGPASN